MWANHLKNWHNSVNQIILSLVLILPVYADIVTDGTVGNAQALVGPNFTIPETLGSRAGDNLFHSFQRFNIFQGESATFTGSNSIANVISRVTGGQASTINGLLRSTVGQADFYFINPAGVMFGANAQIDVPSSFYVSTANELRFLDGAVFSATNPTASTLSIDQPQSFGFLGDQTAKINVVGSTLVLNPGKTLSLSGGELAIEGSRLLTEAGEIQLVATGNVATLMEVGGEFVGTAQGDMNISNSLIDVNGIGAGRVVIRGGLSEINSSSIFANNIGTIDAGSTQGIDISASSLQVASSLITTTTTGQDAADLSVTVDNQLSVVNGGIIGSGTFAAGDAGEVTVNAGQLEVDGQGLVTSISSIASSGSTGYAGNIDVTVKDQLSILNGGQISSNTFSDGNAGEVTVNARQLVINGRGSIFNTGITSQTQSNGDAGTVSVMVKDQLSLMNRGIIDSSTFATGDAGEVSVKSGQLMIDGQNQITGIFSSTSPRRSMGNVGLPKSMGNAGKVGVVVTDGLTIINGGTINTNTSTNGNAGEVTVNAGQLVIDRQESSFETGIGSQSLSSGNAGIVSVKVTDQLSLVNGGIIDTSTFVTGSAGEVFVKAQQLMIDGQNQVTGIFSTTRSMRNAGKVGVVVTDRLTIVNGGTINTNTSAVGDAGEVTVNAGQLIIDRQGSNFGTGIGSQTLSGGNAGTVNVKVNDQLSLVNGGTIDSSTFASGNAGKIKLEAGEIFIDAVNSEFLTGIASLAGIDSSGQAGNVIIDTQNLSIVNGGRITIESLPTVDTAILSNIQPTKININAENITLTNSSITTESSGNVPAGSITLNLADTLSLDPSSISTAANNANGGKISIRAKVIDLQDSQITTSVRGQGDGGDINLDTDVLVLDGGFIQANTSGINARGGDIRINTKALVASNNNLLTGGDTPLSFQPGLNVIQAAAPDGVSGNIDITTPQLDISGDLIDLDSALLNVDDLAQNPCATTGGKQSTLVSLGRGGLPESPEQAGSIVITPERLQWLLPRPDTITDPESGSVQPETTRHKESMIESKMWLAWLEPDCQ